jgi:hypothetical protein
MNSGSINSPAQAVQSVQAESFSLNEMIVEAKVIGKKVAVCALSCLAAGVTYSVFFEEMILKAAYLMLSDKECLGGPYYKARSCSDSASADARRINFRAAVLFCGVTTYAGYKVAQKIGLFSSKEAKEPVVEKEGLPNL